MKQTHPYNSRDQSREFNEKIWLTVRSKSNFEWYFGRKATNHVKLKVKPRPSRHSFFCSVPPVGHSDSTRNRNRNRIFYQVVSESLTYSLTQCLQLLSPITSLSNMYVCISILSSLLFYCFSFLNSLQIPIPIPIPMLSSLLHRFAYLNGGLRSLTFNARV